MHAVYGKVYAFNIRFEKKRNRTEAILEFVQDGEAMDPLTSTGGGVVDVASFALRLASIVLRKPQQRRLMILDEPFRFVSAEYRGRTRQLLLNLAERFSVQFILVTHMPELHIGQVERLSS